MSIEHERDLRPEKWRGEPFGITTEHIAAQIESYWKNLPSWEERLESDDPITRHNAGVYWHMESERLCTLLRQPKKEVLELLERIFDYSLGLGDRDEHDIAKSLVNIYPNLLDYIDLFARAENWWLANLAEMSIGSTS